MFFAGKQGKREASEKLPAKEPAKKAKKEQPAKEADGEVKVAKDTAVKEEATVVGSGRVAAQVAGPVHIKFPSLSR